jgi:glyoxylase-like metal-dependent hydrolase (beta-lactamase superfamily II)
MYLKQMSLGPMSVCCYIIGCETTKKGAVLDPGGEEDRILAAVKQAELDIIYIINTHGHPDHVCGNEIIQQQTGAKIVMHKEDADFFTQPEVKQYFSALGMKESPPIDKTVQDGDIIEIGTLKLQVIHTPGHTPGGMCLYHAPDLFTGDTLFVGGVGRTDFPGGGAHILTESIKKKLLSLPDSTVVWPGHGYGGDSSTIGHEKLSNPFLTGAF